MKKKILKIILINLILILSLSSTVFAGKAWSETEFETFLKNMGYGEHDISSFTDDGGRLSTFLTNLNKSSYSKIILKSPDKTKVYVILEGDVSNNPTYIQMGSDNSKYFLKYYSTKVGNCPCYVFDLSNKTINYGKDYYIPSSWYKSNSVVTEEEWESTEYKTFLFEQICVYSEFPINKTNYLPQGGRITSSGYEDKMYNGSISYGNTTKTATITYTSGFESNTNYDLFLERYQLGETYDYGIAEYPLETIDLGDITTNDTSVNIDISNLALGSMNVYRLCVGINSFNTSGENAVFLCTDWLLPNDNTLRRFPSFARSHYVQPLSLVAFDINYSDPVEPEYDPDYNYPFDTLPRAYIYGGTVLNGYIEDTKNVNVNIKKRDKEIDIKDFYFLLDIYDYETEELLETITIESSGDIDIWGEPLDDEELIYFVIISNYYEFDSNKSCYYSLRLHSYSKGYMEHTQGFWFDINMYKADTLEIFLKQFSNMFKEIINNIISFLFEIDEKYITDLINNFQTIMNDNMGFFSLNNYILQKTCEIFMTDTNEDFILSWNDIKYQNITIIPSGDINFNDTVKSHETFSTVYNYYLIIISCVWIYLFASWLRELLLQLFGFTWLGNSVDENSESTNYTIDVDTGKINETRTQTTRKGNTKTSYTYKRKL